MQNSRCRKGECAKVLTMVNILEQNCEIVNTEKLKDLNSNLKGIQFVNKRLILKNILKDLL